MSMDMDAVNDWISCLDEVNGTECSDKIGQPTPNNNVNSLINSFTSLLLLL